MVLHIHANRPDSSTPSLTSESSRRRQARADACDQLACQGLGHVAVSAQPRSTTLSISLSRAMVTMINRNAGPSAQLLAYIGTRHLQAASDRAGNDVGAGPAELGESFDHRSPPWPQSSLCSRNASGSATRPITRHYHQRHSPHRYALHRRVGAGHRATSRAGGASYLVATLCIVVGAGHQRHSPRKRVVPTSRALHRRRRRSSAQPLPLVNLLDRSSRSLFGSLVVVIGLDQRRKSHVNVDPVPGLLHTRMVPL